MNNGWQELQYVEALKECERLRAENAELLAALKEAVTQVDEDYDEFCAFIARVEGDA